MHGHGTLSFNQIEAGLKLHDFTTLANCHTVFGYMRVLLF